MEQELTAKARVLSLAKVADLKGAEDIVMLDLRKFSFVTDFFLVMTALSQPHARALADAIQEAHPDMNRAERDRREEWTLLDYGDVVVHIFQVEARKFYALDRLWGDAPTTAYPPVKKPKRPIKPKRPKKLTVRVKTKKTARKK